MKYFIKIFLICLVKYSFQVLQGNFKIEIDTDLTNHQLSYIYEFYSPDIIKCLTYCLAESQCAYVVTVNKTLCRFLNSSAINYKITSINSVIYINQIINNYISSRNNPQMINWGNWAGLELCDDRDFVVGFRTKRHSPIVGDNTALNGVELICKNGKKITSGVGDFGDWDTSFKYCANNQSVIGFKYGMRIKGLGDETSTNLIRLVCKDQTQRISLEGPWSSSIQTVSCPKGNIVGIRTQIQPNQGVGDDTGLNNIEFFCRDF